MVFSERMRTLFMFFRWASMFKFLKKAYLFCVLSLKSRAKAITPFGFLSHFASVTHMVQIQADRVLGRWIGFSRPKTHKFERALNVSFL
ncbi:hypothetical protein B9Q01_09800 [Candidatus Marsarchaeota G1 archaeon OSP_D]|uniref:Uncharacterized protein n=1 Tax=Candidatus Marsarchaeota G1 archaeon OSP_D TaxID=1978155 RepID=A0A2R6A5V3_9ARCH|nr:MAG: hypothetical protein B9Q01_09800 [Candidatus Marsarchaeota G1 archaeon OSP_D]